MSAKDKTCLVMGGNGFIGSYLVEQLARQPGWRVRALDRFSAGAQFKTADNIEIVTADIFKDSDMRRVLKGVDYVMHCFSATTPAVSDADPYVDIHKNLIRSVQVFELCVEAGVKKVGFLSSGGTVYGSVSETKAAAETDAPLPVSPYGINKLGIEYYLEYFKHKHGLDYIAYRLTNPYGPRQVVKMKQGVIPIFLDKILEGQEIVIHGDGSSSRDYIYIEDAAEMIIKSFVADWHQYPVYNLGSGVQTSVNDIVAALQTATDKPIKVTHKDAPATFLQKAMVNVDRFTQEFGLQATTSLEDGIKRTVGSLTKVRARG